MPDSNKKIFIVCLLVVGFFVSIWFLARPRQEVPPGGQAEQFSVVTSFYPLYFFTKEIVGDVATVYNMTPAGAEPHDYEPTARDIARLESADLVVVNGGIEPWLEKVAEELGKKQITVLRASDTLGTEEFVDEDGKRVLDPHVWLSPRLARIMVGERILSAFIMIDPTHRSIYEKNAADLDEKLKNLDTTFRSGLSSCASKTIITSHTAFGYLAKEYGLTQVGITGLSPDAEPTPKQLAEIAALAKENNVRTIFFESLTSPELAETLAREIGATTAVLNPLEGLSAEEIAAGKDYFTEMRYNLSQLRNALQCP